jgi:putative PIN family toxin of toxin-antitoxin system
VRISVDSNILLSAALFPDSELAKRFKRIAESHELILPEVILREIADVVSRKFPDSEPDIIGFIDSLEYSEGSSATVNMTDAVPAIRDEKDQAILEAILLADIEYFITGDKDFLAVRIGKPKIVTIAEFVEMYL